VTDELLPPFSARNRGPHARVDNEFPETARVGMHHLLARLVEKSYVEGWSSVIAELQRIARVQPGEGEVPELLLVLQWDKIFDFCERLYSHLAQEVAHYDEFNSERVVIATKKEVQDYISRELQMLFVEEHLAFEFSSGVVRRQGRRNTVDRIARAELVLGDPRLAAALGHFNNALRYFRSLPNPGAPSKAKRVTQH
jgi:hypothetical protein